MISLKVTRSAAFRLALLHTGLFIASVAIIGVVAGLAITRALEAQARDRIEAEAAVLLRQFEEGGASALAPVIAARSSTLERRLRMALIGADGETVAGEPDLAAYAAAATGTVGTRTRHDGDDDAGDGILVGTWPLRGQTLVVADDLASMEDVQRVLWNAFGAALAVAVALGLGAGALLAATVRGRIGTITRTAEAIIAGDLSQRIHLTGSADEFDRLSMTLNTMLDRIAALLGSLSQVTTDIAHDLRTPLTRLRQTLEAARGREPADDGAAAAIDKAIVETDRLLETFSALLRIAELEAGVRPGAPLIVSLSDVLRTVAEAYQPSIEDSGRVLILAVDEGVDVEGDRELLMQLFANLVENALAHTPPRSTIWIGASAADGKARATVADNGPGIPTEERANVLRRFYRLEPSRTTPGTGLGLSLVAAIADLHGASLTLEDNRPGLRATLSFAQAVPRQ